MSEGESPHKSTPDITPGVGSVWSDWSLGFGDNMGNRQGYNGRHDRPVPTLVGAGMFGGPAVVMLRVAGRTRWW